MSDERDNLDEGNPGQFEPAPSLKVEIGRALAGLADVLSKSDPAVSVAEAMIDFPTAHVFEHTVEFPWVFHPTPGRPVGRPEIEADRDLASAWVAFSVVGHCCYELVGDRPEWTGIPVEVDPAGRRFFLDGELRDWLDEHIPSSGLVGRSFLPARLVAAAGGSDTLRDWAGDPTLRPRAVGIITGGWFAGFGHTVPDDFPVGIGEPLLDLLDAEIPTTEKPIFSFDGKTAVAVLQFCPACLDADRGVASFTIGTSVLVFDRGSGATAGDTGRAPLASEIPSVVAGLRELLATCRPAWGERIFARPPGAPTPRRSTRPSLLLDVRSRMDPETVKLATFAVQGVLPRQLRKARRWEEVEAERVAELLGQHGDRAFEKTKTRPALLAKKKGRIVLAERERNLLTTELGTRGGFLKTDSDGEWLVRALRVGAGLVEVGLSWYQSAEKLSSERREAWAEDLRQRLAAAGGQRRLAFDELSDEERGRVEKVLEHIGTLEDARHLLDAVLRKAFATGARVVDIPARELRVLLQCDGPGDRGNEKIRRGFAALEHLSFKVQHRAIKGAASAKFQGRFVSWHGFFNANGAGAHSDGVFVVELAGVVPGVATLLEAAHRGKTSLGAGSAVAALQSSARSPATEKSIELLAGGGPVQLERGRPRLRGERPARALSTVGPWRKRALCSTVEEERAFDFLESNLTTSLAPDVLGRSKRERIEGATTDGLRIYRRDWCPLLGPGDWVGVLGTHRRSPETGWTLSGRGSASTKTGGRKPAGLIDQVGRPYPSGGATAARLRGALQALDDFEAVLVKLGGVLVGVRGRRGARNRPASWDWISAAEGRELDVKDLVGVRWYPFLPADWVRRADEIVERAQAERVAAGEAERPVLVTRSPRDYLVAAEADGIRWQHPPGEIDELDVWPADGFERAAPDVRPLGQRLAEKIEASGMKKGDVARAFGISSASLTRWIRPLVARDEHKGSGVPQALSGLVERWIEGGDLPTAEELDAVSARHGKPRRAGV